MHTESENWSAEEGHCPPLLPRLRRGAASVAIRKIRVPLGCFRNVVAGLQSRAGEHASNARSARDCRLQVIDGVHEATPSAIARLVLRGAAEPSLTKTVPNARGGKAGPVRGDTGRGRLHAIPACDRHHRQRAPAGIRRYRLHGHHRDPIFVHVSRASRTPATASFAAFAPPDVIATALRGRIDGRTA